MDYNIVITKDVTFANTGLRILNSRKDRKAENDGQTGATGEKFNDARKQHIKT